MIRENITPRVDWEKKVEEEREVVVLPVTKKALKKAQKAVEKPEREPLEVQEEEKSAMAIQQLPAEGEFHLLLSPLGTVKPSIKNSTFAPAMRKHNT